ncbi:hypothetical protein QYM36_019738 [Artemia franciscana]|uniref:Uncharacterized protein n=1 Tax=Artemia franciscana TaxID=6661 RepID=A0AA88KT36_ARTSF|nr:hypothetical protein QYM36_019738 [Artemia franciscana]
MYDKQPQLNSLKNQIAELWTDLIGRLDDRHKLVNAASGMNDCDDLFIVKGDVEEALKHVDSLQDRLKALWRLLAEVDAVVIKETLEVSADPDTLKQQVTDSEPIYKEVMNKEQEVVMMLDEGQYLLQNSKRSDAKQQLKLLEKIRAEWKKVKSTTIEKKIAGYDGTKILDESFLAICDIHKEGVIEDVGEVKQKWEGFNAAVQERSQILGDLLLRLADDYCRNNAVRRRRLSDETTESRKTKDCILLVTKATAPAPAHQELLITEIAERALG